MNTRPHSARLCLLPIATILSALTAGVTFAQSTQPTTSPASAPSSAGLDDLRSEQKQLQSILGRDGLATPQRRQQVAPQAVPLLRSIDRHLDLAAAQGMSVTASKQMTLAMLSTLGDPASAAQLRRWAESTDPQQALLGQGGQLLSRWYTAGRDPGQQAPVAADMLKLDKAHPDSQLLTVQTARMGVAATDRALKAQLLSAAANDMKNPAATAFKRQLDAAAERQQQSSSRQAALLQKPMVVSGTTPDGKPFTTADWKGKVILVDFWAVWCVPCRAQLPRVKAMYDQYHDKGLEVLGVSNDYDADRLDAYTAQEHMTWPQLFDVNAASGQNWNPITLGYGIDGIPTMFLIDKQGICQSVTGLQDMETLIPTLLAAK